MKPKKYTPRRGTEDLPFSKYHFRPSLVNPRENPLHWHMDIEFCYVQQDTPSALQIGGSIVPLSKGSIILISPGEIHRYMTYEPGGEYSCFVFMPELIMLPPAHFFYREFLQPLQAGEIRMPRVLRPGHEIYPAVQQQMKKLCSCDSNSPLYKTTVFSAVTSICASILPYCEPIPPSERTNRTNGTIKVCMEYIRAHYAEKLTLQEIADYVHLHPNYLCALFKEHTGQTLFDYLNDMRVRKAARLLRTEHIPIAQVAERCGFGSSNLFARKFKQIMNVTPKEYQKLF